MWPENQVDVEEQHECPEQVGHRGARPGPADEQVPATRYGPAITRVEKSGGRWWGHNDEYATEISFCPWCGRELVKDK
jgi:hypothetical protein